MGGSPRTCFIQVKTGVETAMKLKYMVLLFIICISSAFLVSSSLFQIKAIAVSGNKSVATEEIIRLSSIYYGENIFRINKKSSMKSIFQSPYVKMINIKRHLPNKVEIDIIERDVMAVVPYLGSYLNIDEDGMIIQIDQLIKKREVPVLKGLKFSTFKIGEFLNIENKAQLGVTINVIKEMKNAGLIGQLDEIDVTDIQNIKLKTKGGINVSLGSEDNLNYKVGFMKTILEDVTKQKQKGTIELGNKGNPIFKPE